MLTEISQKNAVYHLYVGDINNTEYISKINRFTERENKRPATKGRVKEIGTN